MTYVVHFNNKTHNLEELGGISLLGLYNEAARLLKEAEVKRFSDRKSALRRTLAILNKARAADAPVPEKKKPVVRKTRGYRFEFPVKVDELKNVQKGTNRAKLIELMQRPQGATFEECLAETWGLKTGTKWTDARKRKTCYEGMRLVHNYVGYGMTQNGEGRVKVFFPHSEKSKCWTAEERKPMADIGAELEAA